MNSSVVAVPSFPGGGNSNIKKDPTWGNDPI